MKHISFRLNLALLSLALASLAILAACQPWARDAVTPTPTPPSYVNAIVEVWSDLAQATPSPQENAIVEVWNTLSQEYVEKDRMDAATLSEAAIAAMREAAEESGDKPDAAMLTEAAIDGMLEALGDPYSAYLSPHEYSMAMEDIEGKFEGIGAVVGLRDGRVTIVAPLPDTPAEREGILPGDVILEVDGASTEGWSLIEAVLKIRGSEGTTVRLLVQHQEAPEPVYIEIVRGVIKLESVQWRMLPGGIAYVGISGFTESTGEALADALGEIREQGAVGIVLDLRDNLGGLLSTTVEVASQFLSDGLVLYSIDGDGKRSDYPVKEGALAPGTPLVVLVNGLSASGSEVLAAALQDHGRAVLIGATTFGKGSVNTPKRLSNGSGLFFTIARWYSPDGRLIEGKGLEPDIRVEERPEGGKDPALERALEHLGALVAAGSR